MTRLIDLAFSAAALGAALPALGCIAYEHRVAARVNDPRRVWVERTDGGERERIEPTRVVDIVDADGNVSGLPHTLEPVELDGDVVRIPICFGRRRGCARPLKLVTTTDNIRLLRERDEPAPFVGMFEALIGAGVIVGSQYAWRPRTSGGPLLLTLGIGIEVNALVQLLAPPKDEGSLLH